MKPPSQALDDVPEYEYVEPDVGLYSSQHSQSILRVHTRDNHRVGFTWDLPVYINETFSFEGRDDIIYQMDLSVPDKTRHVQVRQSQDTYTGYTEGEETSLDLLDPPGERQDTGQYWVEEYARRCLRRLAPGLREIPHDFSFDRKDTKFSFISASKRYRTPIPLKYDTRDADMISFRFEVSDRSKRSRQQERVIHLSSGSSSGSGRRGSTPEIRVSRPAHFDSHRGSI